MINTDNKIVSNGLKVFTVANDKSILNDNSNTRERIFEYSKLVDGYYVVVPSNKKVKINKENLYIYSFGGTNKLFQIIKLFFGSLNILKKQKFDVMSVQDQYYLAFIGYLFSKKFKIGLEIQVHGFEKFYGLRKLIAKFVIPKANSIRVVSNRLKKKLIDEFGVLGEKITVVPIFILIKELETNIIRQRGSEFVFLTVCRLVKVKNIELQINALKDLINKYKNIKLYIVGDGPEKYKLETLVKSLDLENYVEFFAYQKDVEKFYTSADVFVLSSNSEGWPLVIMDAINYNLPIIMTNVGSAGELIINENSGLVIPTNDKNALVEAMEKLFNNPKLRNEFSENARKIALNLMNKSDNLNLYKKSWEKARI